MLNSASQDPLPGPAGVHLDDLSVPGSGLKQPGVAPILKGAPVVLTAVTIQDVIAVQTLQTPNLMKLEVLGVIREIEGPQRCLLQDNTGTFYLGK